MPTTSTASYNADNRVSSSSLMLGGALGYDASGDVTADNANQYAYDGEGRLCAVSNGSGKWGYLYNAEGERVVKGTIATLACPDSAASFTAVTAEYLLNAGGQQATELNGAGAWVHTNVWAGGSLDATYDGSGLHFHLKDPLGTRRVQLSASAGCAEESFQSLPWGNGLTPTPGCGGGDDATEQHFTGKVRDSESGNDYFGARYYASTMGRWTEPDPSGLFFADPGNPQSLNLYAYVQNNPIEYVDPDGLQVDPGATEGWLRVLFGRMGRFIGDILSPMPECQGICLNQQIDRPTMPGLMTAGEQNAGASVAQGGIPVNLTLNLGGVNVKVTYMFGAIFSNYQGGMEITADPQNCASCMWAQVFSRTGTGAQGLTQDGTGVGPLYGQENPNVSNEFYDTPANGPGRGTFTATSLVGVTNIAGKSFFAAGAMTYGYSINGRGGVRMTIVPRVATPGEMYRALQLLKANSPDWQIR